MKFEQAQSLGKDEARRRIEALTDYWHNHYGVAVTWTGDSAKLAGNVKGITFDATLLVTDTSVAAEGSDPGVLMRAIIMGYFKRKLTDYLNPATPVEALERA